MTPLQLAGLFHDTYERLAPEYEYTTRPETREFRPASPNGQLMIAVCKEILTHPRCPHKRLMPMMARVPSNARLPLGKMLKIDYGLGPGSGIELPMKICLDCGTVQGDWPLEIP